MQRLGRTLRHAHVLGRGLLRAIRRGRAIAILAAVWTPVLQFAGLRADARPDVADRQRPPPAGAQGARARELPFLDAQRGLRRVARIGTRRRAAVRWPARGIWVLFDGCIRLWH